MSDGFAGASTPSARALELRARVAEHECAMLAEAFRRQHAALAASELRSAVSAHAEQSMAASVTSLEAALREADTYLADLLGSRTFRSWATVVGYERRRRRRGNSTATGGTTDEAATG